MIVSFNPNMTVAKRNNTSQIAKNNPVAFKRNFTTTELEKMAANNSETLNNVILLIRLGAIKAQDGAKNALEQLIQKHPDKKMLAVVYSKFP